jgi:hypothetical protein
MSTLIEIGEGAFAETGLTSTIIPINCTLVGAEAFMDCTSLVDVSFNRFASNSSNPSYTTLGVKCFFNTPGINSQNYSSLTDMLINGYSEASLRNGTYLNQEFSGAGFDNEAVTNGINASCFNEDTKILCFNSETNEEYYTPVQNLKKGDLIKTHLHGYRKVDVMCKGRMRNSTIYFTRGMYKMRKTETNDLVEDLIVTGGHSILVDELSEKEYDITVAIWGTTLKIDEKYLLMVGLSDKFERVEGEDIYTYYHFCVENDGDNETRYGIWANGVLVETPCKRDILEYKNATYIFN